MVHDRVFEAIERTDCWVAEVEQVAETKMACDPPRERYLVVDSSSFGSGRRTMTRRMIR